jgi:NAD+ synthase
MKELLKIDADKEIARITQWMRETILKRLGRKGAIVAISGGIDSSVVAALCVRSLGAQRVLALMLPETESSDDNLTLGKLLAESLGIHNITETITPLLDAAGCYSRRDQAISALIPEYQPGWKSKLVLPSVVDSDMYRVFSIVVQAPDGTQKRARLTHEAFLGIVAAMNFKQRTRKMLEYYHADRLNYAVAGTPNLLEYDQGFFVKLGDGAADLKPIAHLYKSQVYQLATALGIPPEISRRPPSTDTYSLPQTQEEFYFSLPYDQMDLCLYARNHGIAPAEVAAALGLAPVQVERVFRDIDAKRNMARYLHMPPLAIERGSSPASPAAT